MIDKTAATLALRNRALATVVATTGTASIAATSTGYTRESGSFVADGFAVGMEILASGFATAANNGTGVITFASAGTLLVTAYTISYSTSTGLYSSASRTLVAESATGNEVIVANLPVMRAWENMAFNPITGVPYVEEDFVPATTELLGQKNGGILVESGLYVLKLYGLSGKGVTAIRRTMDALEARFAIGTPMAAGSHTVVVGSLGAGSTQRGPSSGQIIPQGDGRSVCVLTVPWYAQSINAVAA